MGLSGFLDIAIGLIFLYLVLSLICTIINELVATTLAVRAKTLAKTMRTLIDDPQIREAFYNHGLITNAAQASREGAGDVQKGQIYIPPDNKHPSYFDARTVALALLDSITPKDQRDPEAQAEFPTLDQIKDSVAKLGDSNIRDVLLSSLATAGGDLAKARADLEKWFDSAMDRLSGGYKRWAKKWALIIGIGIAVIFNADSVHVSQKLWADETLRAQMVESASAILQDRDLLRNVKCEPVGNATEQTDTSQGSEGSNTSSGAADQTDATQADATQAETTQTDTTQTSTTQVRDDQTDPSEKMACLLKQFGTQQDNLRPLPIGWTKAQLAEFCEFKLDWFIFKIIGLLWTGLALSLGAPFWFDILDKFMSIRGAQKPEKTAEEQPKPATS